MVNLIAFDAVYMTFSKSKILDGKADNFMCLGKKNLVQKVFRYLSFKAGNPLLA